MCHSDTGLYAFGASSRSVRYALKVAGRSITSKNCENFTDEALIEDKVSYNAMRKELLLNNAVINTDRSQAIYSEINGLKIIMRGKCNMTSSNTSTFRLPKMTTIIGESLADE